MPCWRDLKIFTQGCCTPAYGTIYPILKELLEGEYASVRVGHRERTPAQGL